MSTGSDFLAAMARASESRARKLAVRAVELERQARDEPPPPPLRLSPEGFDIIGEVKLSSPSSGALSGDAAGVASRAATYARAGACAVSVLTEPDRFAGDIDHLRRVASALAPLGVPAMAKDFLVAPEQLLEARAAGGGGALLIVRMLDDVRLGDMLETAISLGLFVLLEAFDDDDLARASAIIGESRRRSGRLMVGLNCRDLRTLKVDPDRFGEMASQFPGGIPRVAESGIETPEDAGRVARQGYDLALVGTALMRADDPGVLLGRMIAAGRAAMGGGSS